MGSLPRDDPIADGFDPVRGSLAEEIAPLDFDSGR
jgi:hypothetical protein